MEAAQWSVEERTLSDLAARGRTHRVRAPLIAVIASSLDQAGRTRREGNVTVATGGGGAEGVGVRRGGGRADISGAGPPGSTSGGSPFDSYLCPLYKSPARGKDMLVATVAMTTRDSPPERWAMRGVALLMGDPDLD